MAFDLSSYEPVSERITKFWAKYPQGRLHTEIVLINETEVVVKASAYTDKDDTRAAAIDFAQETRNSSHINKNNFLENASTSAIGRVLNTVGISSKGGKRPSREEMIKVVSAQRNFLEEASDAAANKDLEALRVIYASAEKSQVDNEILDAIKKLAESLKAK
ncbi:hypothetical protein UFOVP332_22 [uncultured Caudovirales phage]|jgi:hypothetical protein|uniref:Uncharacterized protein n=1 Tax=uncultured Caudovirales phage TaxID=2100421 RepID=A0A6J5LZ47_9CAUD|nr:hypothetical protein UFOVP332_22 [uncultured Caudovirales phage]